MKLKNRFVTVTVDVEYEGVRYTRGVRTKNVSILAYLMRDIAKVGQELRQDILLSRRAERKKK
ncbi:hypothetical protein LCGC14_3053160 [marine sediment metagenome]|uniref:Uncharacterized protein n=1 Tax=marine sediment metagenome TaxID=412755 RepID=A0A0F8WLK0_9ZZZZ